MFSYTGAKEALEVGITVKYSRHHVTCNVVQ